MQAVVFGTQDYIAEEFFQFSGKNLCVYSESEENQVSICVYIQVFSWEGNSGKGNGAQLLRQAYAHRTAKKRFWTIKWFFFLIAAKRFVGRCLYLEKLFLWLTQPLYFVRLPFPAFVFRRTGCRKQF